MSCSGCASNRATISSSVRSTPSSAPSSCCTPCVTCCPPPSPCSITIWTPPVPCGPCPPKCGPPPSSGCSPPNETPKCLTRVATRPLCWTVQIGCTVTIPPAPIPQPKRYVPKLPCCRPGCFHKPRPVCCRYLYWRLPCKAHCFEVW